MREVISVRFPNGSRNYDFDPCGLRLRIGQEVIVETTQGLEFAICTRGNRAVQEGDEVRTLSEVIRIATDEDRRILAWNRARERDAFRIGEERIAAHGLEMKGDWQIFPVVSEKFPKGRTPDAVGYRYGRSYTVPRKRNFLRMKRSVKRYRKKTARGQPVPAGMADSILSRLGTLKHCNNYHAYKVLFNGERIVRDLKNIVRKDRREMITWSMFLEAGKEAAPHRTSSGQKERDTPTFPAT